MVKRPSLLVPLQFKVLCSGDLSGVKTLQQFPFYWSIFLGHEKCLESGSTYGFNDYLSYLTTFQKCIYFILLILGSASCQMYLGLYKQKNRHMTAPFEKCKEMLTFHKNHMPSDNSSSSWLWATDLCFSSSASNLNTSLQSKRLQFLQNY